MTLLRLPHRNTSRRLWAAVATIVIAIVTAFPADAGQTDAAKPTIVLVHGAFLDGSSWQQVVAILQRNQYNVVAVQVPLTSLADDVQATRRVLETLRGPIVLAGHSWGGAIITDAAAGNTNVKSLVYVAAFAPDAGEVVTAFGKKYPDALGAALKADSAGFLSVDPAKFHEVFAQDLPIAQARITAAAQNPILGSAFGNSVVAASWRSIPSWYLITLDDHAINPALQRFYADRIKATTREIKSSHAVVASHPADVARLIEEAATSKTRTETRR